MFYEIVSMFGVLLLLNPSSSFKIQPRIVNGSPSELGQFPYFALLEIKVKFRQQERKTCGGSLLNAEFVLTAAHCLQDATKVLVHLGSLRKDEYEEGRHVFFARRRHLYIHPNWNTRNLFCDIAIIKLSRPALYSHLIHPIKLPGICDLPSGTELMAIGNGFNATNGDLTDILHYTQLTTMPFLDCEYFFGLYDKSSIFCAKGYVNNSICNGDSGGPIADPISNTLYGVTSFRDKITGCNGTPQGFTNVSMFLPWISEITGIDVFVDCMNGDDFQLIIYSNQKLSTLQKTRVFVSFIIFVLFNLQ